MSASRFKPLAKKPCFTSWLVRRSVTGWSFFRLISAGENSKRFAVISITRRLDSARAKRASSVATIATSAARTATSVNFFFIGLLLHEKRGRERSSPDGPRRILSLLHNQFAGHLWMNRTVVVVSARLGKCERKLIVRIERFGFEFAVVADDGVRHVIAIRPGDLRSRGNSNRGWLEAEVVDLDLELLGIAFRGCRSRHRAAGR